MRPLEGIRVTDFTNHAAGPYCALMLALLGAEVIRIESRARLDIQRRPHPVYGRTTIPNFDHLAGHKMSITLNLKTDTGNVLAKELVAVSDVVVENFRPGVMGRLGLGWDDLSDINPDLIMLSLSAYGQEGPKSRRPGYAPIFAAEGGLGYMTGYPDGAPGEIRNNMDHQAGLTAAVTILSLLEERDISGQGAYADLSACEVAAMLVGESIVRAVDGETATRLGTDHEIWCPHGVYPAAGDDRWVAIAVRSDDEWSDLVEAMGNPSWARGLEHVADRRLRKPEINERLSAWTHNKDASELATLLQSQGLCAEVSMSAADINSDAHINARGSITTLNHPEYGERRVIEAPWRFQLSPAEYTAWSPALGAHNEEVICGILGHSPSDLQTWIEEGAVN